MLRALRVLRGDTYGSMRPPLEAPQLEQLENFRYYVLGSHANISLKRTNALKNKKMK